MHHSTLKTLVGFSRLSKRKRGDEGMGNSILNECCGEWWDLILAAEKCREKVKVRAPVLLVSLCAVVFIPLINQLKARRFINARTQINKLKGALNSILQNTDPASHGTSTFSFSLLRSHHPPLSLPLLWFLLAAWRLALLKIDWRRAFSRVVRRRGKFWQAGVKWKEGLGGHSVERSQWGDSVQMSVCVRLRSDRKFVSRPGSVGICTTQCIKAVCFLNQHVWISSVDPCILSPSVLLHSAYPLLQHSHFLSSQLKKIFPARVADPQSPCSCKCSSFRDFLYTRPIIWLSDSVEE